MNEEVNINSRRTPGPISVLLQNQQTAWMNGGRPKIEDLLADSQDDRESQSSDRLLCLICNEVFLREQSGETPNVIEYQERFPQYAEAIAIQWQIDHLLATTGATLHTLGIDQKLNQSGNPVKSGNMAGMVFANRYQIDSILGFGGMGIVYRALDIKLNRTVALKCLRSGELSDEDIKQRFQQEAMSVAKLNHRNIVQVYDVSEFSGQTFIVMEYCEHGSLAALLRKQTLDVRSIAGLCQQIANGVASSHAARIVHRDLKPANILLCGTDERRDAQELGKENSNPILPDWVIPKIADFGLAKLIDTTANPSTTGDIIGTPAYMAPEQTYGLMPDSAHLADIYSLGAILYECLTGRPPIRGATLIETIQLLKSQEPVRVRQLQPTVPKDLETIAHKCLDSQPSRRYATASELAQDLQRFLRGEPVLARPVGSWIRLAKWARRRPGIAATSAIAFAALIGVATVWAVFTQELKVAKETAEKEQASAAIQRDRATRNAKWAMEAVDEFITQVGDQGLAKIPGMDKTRKALLESAVKFSKRFDQDANSDDPDARNQLALSYRRLAKIHRMLGEKQEWLESLEYASKLHRELVESHPANEEYLLELSKTLNNLGNVHAEVYGPTRSIQTLQESIDIKERLLEKKSTSIEYLSMLATSLTAIGPKYRVQSPEKAIASYQRAEQILIRLVQQEPNEPMHKQKLMGLYNNLCALQCIHGQMDNAWETADKHSSLLSSLGIETDPNYRIAYAENLMFRSSIAINQRDFRKALTYLEREMEVRQDLLKDFPERAELQANLIRTQFNLGATYSSTGLYDKARSLHVGALDWLRAAYGTDRKNPFVNRELCNHTLGLMMCNLGLLRLDEILQNATDSSDLINATLDAKVQSPDVSAAACNILVHKAWALAYNGDHETAHETMTHVHNQLLQIMATNDSHYDTNRLFALTTSSCVLFYLRNNNLDAAKQWIQSSRAVWPSDRTWSLQALEKLVEAHEGDYRSALKVFDGSIPAPEKFDMLPDRLLILIPAMCLKHIANDSSLAIEDRRPLENRCVHFVRQELADLQSIHQGPFFWSWFDRWSEYASVKSEIAAAWNRVEGHNPN